MIPFYRPKREYAEIEKAIGYRFRNQTLLQKAMTHRSYRFETPGVDFDNQRLEFLGDAVLGFIAADCLFKTFKDKDEGHLTAFRSQLTSGKALAELASSVQLGQFLKVGKGEANSGGRHRPSTMADALESIMGAAYLDGGEKAVRKIFDKLFMPLFRNLSGDVWEENPKGKLQELVQRHWKSSPVYRLVRRDGPPHAAIFTVEVRVRDEAYGRGSGRNKQDAESAAATQALSRLMME